MCGIAGYLNIDPAKKSSSTLAQNMIDVLSHRGPDDSNIFTQDNLALGHRRLSIIDIEGGNQPMRSECGRYVIVFNGEIYNYQRLKSELKSRKIRFKTNSDTEVILKYYEIYGENCVTKFNGMFAIAIWDTVLKTLFLARDRLGEKPLYYYFDDKKFIFASEIKSILKVLEATPTIDYSALGNYFHFDYIPEPDSIYKEIKKLKPGHSILVKDAKIDIKKYWEIPQSFLENRSVADYCDELRFLAEDSVRLRMISDVPLGVFLSGGLDSSIITGLMAKISGNIPVRTFSIRGGEGEFDELKYAKDVSIFNQTIHTEFESASVKIQDLLPTLVKHLDEPFADSSIIPTYHVTRLAREKVTVALSGEGGDELFGGYDWHARHLQIRKYAASVPKSIRELLFTKLLINSEYPTHYNNLIMKTLSRISLGNRLSLKEPSEIYRSQMIGFSDNFYAMIQSDKLDNSILSSDSKSIGPSEIFESRSGSNDILDSPLTTDLMMYLPSDLLVKVDRMSMLNSLEVRCPLLDHRLIEFAANVPSNLKISGHTRKFLFKTAFKDLLPSSIYNRKNKRGFSISISSMLHGDFMNYVKEVVLDNSIINRGFFNRASVEFMLEIHHKKTQDYGPQIWNLLIFSLWLNQQEYRYSI
ncbi:asparagine synthase (glutamine-hydrolyzing) [Gammaproteobacteria bacterium]|nr:asparagine synthase (glutamine-hydrolyzing) [Gammaproteobacteria bacterium]